MNQRKYDSKAFNELQQETNANEVALRVTENVLSLNRFKILMLLISL